LPPVDESSDGDKEDVAPLGLSNGDYVLNDEEEVTVIQHVTVKSEAEARAVPPRAGGGRCACMRPRSGRPASAA
jgi:hypothetical protein